MRRRDDDWKPRGLCVEVRQGNVEQALRRLKRLAAEEGLFDEMARHEHYVKPSEIKRSKRNEGRKKQIREHLRLEKEMIVVPPPPTAHPKSRRRRF